MAILAMDYMQKTAERFLKKIAVDFNHLYTEYAVLPV